jgi:hypothetical protein
MLPRRMAPHGALPAAALQVPRDVVLGYDTVPEYIEAGPAGRYLGCTVGRVANRLRPSNCTALLSVDSPSIPFILNFQAQLLLTMAA